MNATAPIIPMSQFQPVRPDRKVWLKKKNGSLVGGNFTIPNGNFARFLGWKEPTTEEKEGKVSGRRALEVALEKKFQQLGKQSMVNGMAFRNMYVSWGRYANLPGRDRDRVKDGLDAIRSSVDMNQAGNMLYLEMQYKFELAGKNFGVISNLMRVRNEATKKAVDEVR